MVKGLGMTVRRRSVALALAAAFAWAPSLALAAVDCSSCCCPPVPCGEEMAQGCATLAEAPCRDEAPTLPSVAKRTAKTPSFHAVVFERVVPVSDACGVRPLARGGGLEALVSPLRLSVVLRI